MSANTTVLFGKFEFGAHTTLDVGLPPAGIQSSLKTVCPGITKASAPASAITSCALSPAGAVGDKCPTIRACPSPCNCTKVRFTVEIILDNSQFLPAISLSSHSPALPFKHDLKSLMRSSYLHYLPNCSQKQ